MINNIYSIRIKSKKFTKISLHFKIDAKFRGLYNKYNWIVANDELDRLTLKSSHYSKTILLRNMILRKSLKYKYGQTVFFKDGNPFNMTIENMYMQKAEFNHQNNSLSNINTTTDNISP